MTWPQLVILCMIESGGPVTAAIVRDWIRKRCPSKYEKSTSIPAVFHNRTHLYKSWVVVKKGSYKLLKAPEDVKVLYDTLEAYNAYHNRQPDRDSGPVHPPTPAASLSEVTTRPKSQGQVRHASSESGSSQKYSLQPPLLPPTRVSSFSSFSSLSSLPSASASSASASPSPENLVAMPGPARPPGDDHPEAVGAVFGRVYSASAAKGVSKRATVKPYAFTKEVLEESRLAWILEKKSEKTAVASPEDYRQPVEMTMAFIMSLGSGLGS